MKYGYLLPGGSIGFAYGAINYKGVKDMLTPKQESFVQNIIAGMTQAEAYKASYSTRNMTDKTIYECASRLMADHKISARIKELREEIAKDTIMSVQDRMEWLTEVINDPKTSISARLAASDQMNKMQGAYIQKIAADVEVTKTTISIDLVDDDE